MLVSKIISGGQTGVDRGALEAALALGFPYGGLVPKGRRAEDGVVPAQFDQMTEAPFEGYVYRTEQNVRQSDCTLIIWRSKREEEPISMLCGGTLKTYKFCLQHRKPCLVVCKQDVRKVIDWLAKVCADLKKDGLVLNVAGPRESKVPGIENSTCTFVKKLIGGLGVSQLSLEQMGEI